MNDLDSYKSRFYNLLESKLGDVKPLLTESPNEPIYWRNWNNNDIWEFLKGGTSSLPPDVIKQMGGLANIAKMRGTFWIEAKALYPEVKDGKYQPTAWDIVQRMKKLTENPQIPADIKNDPGIWSLRQTAESMWLGQTERSEAKRKIHKYLKNYANEFEVLKSQKGYYIPEYYCDPCKFTITGTLSGDIKAGKTCINIGIYSKEWKCNSIDLLSSLIREYGISFNANNSDRANVIKSITKIPNIQYEDILKDPHFLLTIAEIATATIPIVGPFISAGIGLTNAYLYHKEGDDVSAGIGAVFSILPFAGPALLKLIPGVNKLGANGLEELAEKVISKEAKALTNTEFEVLTSLVKNKEAVETGIKQTTSQLETISDVVSKYRKPYIDRYGIEAYEKEIKSFISGESDKIYLEQKLQSSLKPQPGLAQFVNKFGIKFKPTEISDIENIIKLNLENPMTRYMPVDTIDGVINLPVKYISVDEVIKVNPKLRYAAMIADADNKVVYIITENSKNLNQTQLIDKLTHEVAHIKDPAMVKSPKLRLKYNTEVEIASKEIGDANELYKLGYTDDAIKLNQQGMQRYSQQAFEVNANSPMLRQRLATNAKELQDRMTKDQIIDGLDNIINFGRYKGQQLSSDAYSLLGLGDSELKNQLELLTSKPEEYKIFWSKLVRQAEYLKDQVKLSM